MVRDMKPLPDRDPARSKLAAAIALEAGARRALQVAEQAAELAASRHWEAHSALDELRNVVASPSGALAADFIASVGAGNPCGATVLERSAIEARGKMAAAENDVNVWKQTHEECDLAVRAKEAEVADAREHVKRAARMVIADSETAARLMNDVAAMQAELIEKRVALRFIWGKGLNGELSQSNKDRIESLLREDLTGGESYPVHGVWRAAFDALMIDPDVALPTEIARR